MVGGEVAGGAVVGGGVAGGAVVTGEVGAGAVVGGDVVTSMVDVVRTTVVVVACLGSKSTGSRRANSAPSGHAASLLMVMVDPSEHSP